MFCLWGWEEVVENFQRLYPTSSFAQSEVYRQDVQSTIGHGSRIEDYNLVTALQMMKSSRDPNFLGLDFSEKNIVRCAKDFLEIKRLTEDSRMQERNWEMEIQKVLWRGILEELEFEEFLEWSNFIKSVITQFPHDISQIKRNYLTIPYDDELSAR